MMEFFTWRLRRRDYFFLMSCLGIRGVSVNTVIANRRWWDHALMLGWRRNYLSPTVGSGLIFALGSGLPGRIACVSERRVESPERHEQRHP